MKPNADHNSTPVEKTPEADPNISHRATKKSRDAIEQEGLLQLTKPHESYSQISIVRSGAWLYLIISANCLISALICICLWSFSKIDNLTPWQKRSFNTSSLLLSAALAFGIGFLFDQIGLLARWTVFQGSRPCSDKEARYIIRGTLSSYALLFKNQVSCRRGRGSTTFLLFLFLLCSILGRFGVALLGFAFNLEDTAYFDHALFTPDWENGMFRGSGFSHKALATALGIPEELQDVGQMETLNDWGILFSIAQNVMGQPWLLPRSADMRPYLNYTNATTYAMDIRHFETGNLDMQVLSDNTVSFTYKFQDFRGETAVPAERLALASWVTRCQEFLPLQYTSVPLRATNFTSPGYTPQGSYRWITIFPQSQQSQQANGSYIDRNYTYSIWLVGESMDYDDIAPGLTPTSPLLTEHSYLANHTIIFNCSVSLNPGRIGDGIGRSLRMSLSLPFSGIAGIRSREYFRDSYSTIEFDFGVSRQDRGASARWLAAYIGNYLGNCLSYLNEVLRRVKIEAEDRGINTKLEVRWVRVAGTLGGLAGFQIIFGVAALLYCRRGFHIVEDVSALSCSATDFPVTSHSGKRE